MNETIYKCKGYVLGNYWGGGQGSYPIVNLQTNTQKQLVELAEQKLKDGSLDSGMGYESLIGAKLDIEEYETIILNNKTYNRSEYHTELIGELTEEQAEFLESLNDL